MDVFHVFKIVQMVLNRATHHKWIWDVGWWRAHWVSISQRSNCKINSYMPYQYVINNKSYVPVHNNRSIGNDVCDSMERVTSRGNDFPKLKATDQREVFGWCFVLDDNTG